MGAGDHAGALGGVGMGAIGDARSLSRARMVG